MNRTPSLRLVLMLAVLACLTGTLQAQDIHFSQFDNAPLNLNPGLTGIFGGDVRFVGNYRNQWRSVRVPYTTFSATVENKWYYKRGDYSRFFTSGLLVNYDRQGSLKLRSLQIGIPVALTLPVGKSSFLSLGVIPSFGQRAFSTHEWSFDAQFVDCMYNPLAPTMEDGLLVNTDLKYFDLSTGLNYRFQAPVSRTRLDFGGALHHVNRPDQDFWTNTEEVRLARRGAVYGIGLIQISSPLDLIVHAMYQEQGGYREILYGAGIRFNWPDNKPYSETALQGKLSYRNRYNDALVGRLEFFHQTWSVGLSYDFNLSDFQVATENRGGWEVSFIYRLYKIKPAARLCPID